MARYLVQDRPFPRFSDSPTGLAPGVTVTLHMPASGRVISNKRALIDTGTEITQVYPSCVAISPATDADADPDAREFVVGVELEGEIYYVQCVYEDHEYAGNEDLLIGMDVLENWLVTLHGRRHLLSITHLDPGD